MSLMQLLSAGKSWVSGKDEAVRYRMGDPRALPTFGSGKNPFRSTTRSAQVSIEPPASVEPALAESPGQVGVRTAPVRRSLESPTTSALLPERCQHSSAVRAGTVRAPNEQRVSGLGSWWEKLAALVPRSRRKPAPGKAALREKPVVQGELSLEKIRVMRNDLSDTDLEIVPSTKKPVMAKPAAPRESEHISPPESDERVPGAQEEIMAGRS